jgi:hypothetical protein
LNTNSISLAGGEVLTFTASNALTLATTGSTSVTLPTTGTLANLLGAQSMAAKTIVQAANDFPLITVSSVSGTGATTLTAAQLIGGLINRSGMTSGRSDPTDSAANIVAAIPNAVVGTSFRFTIRNTTATYTETITAGSGVTLVPATITIPTVDVRNFLAICTNVTGGAQAVSIYDLGASSAY